MASINEILGNIITFLDNLKEGEAFTSKKLAVEIETKPSTGDTWFRILEELSHHKLIRKTTYHGNKKLVTLEKSHLNKELKTKEKNK